MRAALASALAAFAFAFILAAVHGWMKRRAQIAAMKDQGAADQAKAEADADARAIADAEAIRARVDAEPDAGVSRWMREPADDRRTDGGDGGR